MPEADNSTEMAGIPHAPGTETVELEVRHPKTGETHEIHVPVGHDGSRIKVEFPDGETAYTDGWDPAQRALVGERPIVPCGKCGAPQVLTTTEFNCSACGEPNRIELKTSSDRGEATTTQSAG